LLLLYSHVRASIQEAAFECIPTRKDSPESPGTAGAGCDQSNPAASNKTRSGSASPECIEAQHALTSNSRSQALAHGQYYNCLFGHRSDFFAEVTLELPPAVVDIGDTQIHKSVKTWKLIPCKFAVYLLTNMSEMPAADMESLPDALMGLCVEISVIIIIRY
jgi:hypothetical protein